MSAPQTGDLFDSISRLDAWVHARWPEAMLTLQASRGGVVATIRWPDRVGESVMIPREQWDRYLGDPLDLFTVHFAKLAYIPIGEPA